MAGEHQARVFGIGFHRTGTTSLRRAFEILGYRVKGETPSAIVPAIKNNTSKLRKIISDCTAAEDAPWFMLYRQLDEMYPGSKFILTIRNEEAWYRSAHKRFHSFVRLKNAWIYGVNNGLLQHKEKAIDTFRAHNTAVKEYFTHRPDDLLVMDLTAGDGWEVICPFLGHPVPETPFPYVNKTGPEQSQPGTFKLWRKNVKNYAVIQYLRLTGRL